VAVDRDFLEAKNEEGAAACRKMIAVKNGVC